MATLESAVGKLLSAFERLSFGEGWLWKTGLASLVLALLCSFPHPVATLDIGTSDGWGSVLQQVEHPLRPQAHDPASHAAKTAFRLVVPAVGHALGLGPVGLKLLEVLCGTALFFLVALSAWRASGERSGATLLTLTVASCYIGIAAFVEHRATFDGVAMLGLALASASRHPLGVLAGISMACWTDERGALAAGLVALLHFVDAPRDRAVAQRALDPRCLAVGGGLLLYAAGRAWLGSRYGLQTPLAGTGLHNLKTQVNNMPLGLWSGLEGGWVLVLAAAISLWQAGRRLLLLATILAGGLVVGAAFLVWDITRSMIYLLPALFLALRVLREHEPHAGQLRLFRVAFLISLLWPNLYVAGRHEVFWHYPLPVMALKYLQR